ncbi:hypothetical protein HZA85_03135 [Candidatus Uhrbacteria bacterium]|nr:hypothetical protein [Candidatus Uhrbacteria bacterium]
MNPSTFSRTALAVLFAAVLVLPWHLIMRASAAEPDHAASIVDAGSDINDATASAATDTSSIGQPDAGSAPDSADAAMAADALGVGEPDAGSLADTAPGQSDAQPLPASATPTALEVAIQHVFDNERIPKEAIDALSCDDFVQVENAIRGRHGFFFQDEAERQAFATAHRGKYVPLPHVNDDTLQLYLTSSDKLNRVLIGSSAYDKACHRRESP